MKRILLFAAAVVMSMHLNAQSNPKASKNKDKVGKELNNSNENVDQDGEKPSKSKKSSSKKGDKTTKEKTGSKKSEPQKKAVERKAPPRPAPRPPRPSRTKSNAPEPDPEVVQMYFELPSDALPIIQDYVKREGNKVDNEDLKDGNDLRRGFIRTLDGTKGYIHLQKTGEVPYTRIKEFKTKDFKRIMAVETTTCAGSCDNQLKFYRKDGSEWKDVTEEYIYKPSPKTVVSRLRDKYKETFMDLEEFDAKDYNQEANYVKAIVYTISPDVDKIVIKEQYLPLPLYEMVWDANKGKFSSKKL